MLSKSFVSSALLIPLSIAAMNARVDAANVALNAPVTLQGIFGVATSDDWGHPPSAAAATITDGSYLTDGVQWNFDSVWWDARNGDSSNNAIIVTLPSIQSIDSFRIQADNNDAYQVDYWTGSDWAAAGTLPSVDGWGMRTGDLLLAASIITDSFRISASGDGWYSVSEFQAYAVPVPGAALLFSSAIVGLVFSARRSPRRSDCAV
jgi:hypothetical protein